MFGNVATKVAPKWNTDLQWAQFSCFPDIPEEGRLKKDIQELGVSNQGILLIFNSGSQHVALHSS